MPQTKPTILPLAAESIRTRYDKHQEWRGERTSYKSSEVPEGYECPTNEEVSALEQYNTFLFPPDNLFLYVERVEQTNRTAQRHSVHTFMGDSLGKVVAAGTPFKSNMGDTRQAISVRLNDKDKTLYHGFYYGSAGDYCRLKKAKVQA